MEVKEGGDKREDQSVGMLVSQHAPGFRNDATCKRRLCNAIEWPTGALQARTRLRLARRSNITLSSHHNNAGLQDDPWVLQVHRHMVRMVRAGSFHHGRNRCP